MMKIDDGDYHNDDDLAHGDDGNYDTVDVDNGGDGIIINLAHGDDTDYHSDGDDDLAHGDGLLRFSRLAHLAGSQAVRFSMIHLMLKMILMT